MNTPLQYGPLADAEWHGWTSTDWVFPLFVSISGMAMTMSRGRRAAQGTCAAKGGAGVVPAQAQARSDVAVDSCPQEEEAAHGPDPVRALPQR